MGALRKLQAFCSMIGRTSRVLLAAHFSGCTMGLGGRFVMLRGGCVCCF